ncbi:hypothetical protein BCR42DRAFT_487777 [Absidia repens]|uniref:BHLH domain-containing protein n=1 Tax=Absidia repens TaxID=90262 RepID=A0A1X2ITT5_9FUNG|nr:hypothetical protein BCR42DRAFT_487777 [Absidia repens]
MNTTAVNDVNAQKNSYSFLDVDPFPFTNANLTDPLNMPVLEDDDIYDTNASFSKKTLSKDERRAEHNAIERARRESLNSKFQQLAQALPNLMNYRRPSKSQIVEKALDWVKKSISREERYRYQVIQLQKENKKLLTQLMGNHSSASPSVSMSTPISTTDSNHGRHHQPAVPTSRISASSVPASSSNHHAFASSVTTTTDIPTLRQPVFGDLPSESSWLSAQQSPSPAPLFPSSLASPFTYGSMDDLHTIYDTKNLDPAIFQSQSTDLYLDTMMTSSNYTNGKLPPSPGFIQPTASRSTPAFSSAYRM